MRLAFTGGLGLWICEVCGHRNPEDAEVCEECGCYREECAYDALADEEDEE
ncbi:MAG: hypothetical protein ACPLKZ_01590 [Candidatus Bathyarchaeales archaeon]